MIENISFSLILWLFFWCFAFAFLSLLLIFITPCCRFLLLLSRHYCRLLSDADAIHIAARWRRAMRDILYICAMIFSRRLFGRFHAALFSSLMPELYLLRRHADMRVREACVREWYVRYYTRCFIVYLRCHADGAARAFLMLISIWTRYAIADAMMLISHTHRLNHPYFRHTILSRWRPPEHTITLLLLLSCWCAAYARCCGIRLPLACAVLEMLMRRYFRHGLRDAIAPRFRWVDVYYVCHLCRRAMPFLFFYAVAASLIAYLQ